MRGLEDFFMTYGTLEMDVLFFKGYLNYATVNCKAPALNDISGRV